MNLFNVHTQLSLLTQFVLQVWLVNFDFSRHEAGCSGDVAGELEVSPGAGE